MERERMEKYRQLRTVAIVLAVLMGVELVMLFVMLRPKGFLLLALAVIAVVGAALARLALGLIKEILENRVGRDD